jgi:transposase
MLFTESIEIICTDVKPSGTMLQGFASFSSFIETPHAERKTCNKGISSKPESPVKAKILLAEQVYVCDNEVCGLVIDRDFNAALNLAALAT